jgi:hypothetical protein
MIRTPSSGQKSQKPNTSQGVRYHWDKQNKTSKGQTEIQYRLQRDKHN